MIVWVGMVSCVRIYVTQICATLQARHGTIPLHGVSEGTIREDKIQAMQAYTNTLIHAYVRPCSFRKHRIQTSTQGQLRGTACTCTQTQRTPRISSCTYQYICMPISVKIHSVEGIDVSTSSD